VNDELYLEALLCEEYEKLLKECQRSLDQWNERSEGMRQTHENGEAAGRELLRLQAGFAKSYTVLQRHVERCQQCQLVARMNQNIGQLSMDTLAAGVN